MNKEFAPYELAIQLKEIGCIPAQCGAYQTQENNRLIIHWYNKRDFEIAPHLIPAPLFQQAFEWFRTEHKLRSFVDTYAQDKENDFKSFYTIKSGNGYDKEPFFSGTFKTYEDAQLGCLQKLIELAQKK